MKKSFLIKLLTTIFALCSCLTLITGCVGEPEHSCVYDKQVAEASYLATEATCTAKATYYKSCTCGAVGVETFEVGELASHNYQAVVTAPTCEEKGYTTYTCACSNSYIADKVDALGHEYTSVVNAPTCTEKGYVIFTCQREDCPHSFRINQSDALGHEYTSVVTNPTCEKGGYTTYTCVRGDHTYIVDKVDALGHKYTSVTTNPTCEEDGYTTYTCVRGDHTYIDDQVDALGHNYDEEVIEPTCTTKGYTRFTCVNVNCDYEYTGNEVDMLPHTFTAMVVNWETAETRVTCTYDGVYFKSCEDCGAVSTDDNDKFIVEKLTHYYDPTVNYACEGCTQMSVADLRVGEDENTLFFFDREVGLAQVRTLERINLPLGDTFDEQKKMVGMKIDNSEYQVSGIVRIPLSLSDFDFETQTKQVEKDGQLVNEVVVTDNRYIVMNAIWVPKDSTVAQTIALRANINAPCYGTQLNANKTAQILLPANAPNVIVDGKIYFTLFDIKNVVGTLYLGKGVVVDAEDVVNIYNENAEYTLSGTQFVGLSGIKKIEGWEDCLRTEVGENPVTVGTCLWTPDPGLYNQESDVIPYYVNGAIRLYVRSHYSSYLFNPSNPARLALKTKDAISGLSTSDTGKISVTMSGAKLTTIIMRNSSTNDNGQKPIKMVEDLGNGFYKYTCETMGSSWTSDVYDIFILQFEYLDPADGANYQQVLITDITFTK